MASFAYFVKACEDVSRMLCKINKQLSDKITLRPSISRYITQCTPFFCYLATFLHSIDLAGTKRMLTEAIILFELPGAAAANLRDHP